MTRIDQRRGMSRRGGGAGQPRRRRTRRVLEGRGGGGGVAPAGRVLCGAEPGEREAGGMAAAQPRRRVGGEIPLVVARPALGGGGGGAPSTAPPPRPAPRCRCRSWRPAATALAAGCCAPRSSC